MRVGQVTIERFRGIKRLQFEPGPRCVILGPNNSGKTTVLEALDLLLHHGIGRPRPAPSEIDYYGREPSAGFTIEAVLGSLPSPFLAMVRQHLEGWDTERGLVVPEPDGKGIQPVVRVRARGTPDLEVLHEFSKPESDGARFGPMLRAQVAWVFDGRARDPSRQLAFYQGGLLERLFAEADLGPAVDALRNSLGEGARGVNDEPVVKSVLDTLSADLHQLGLVATGEVPSFEVGAVSPRELLQTLRLALPSASVPVPLARQGRGAQRLLLVAVLLRLANGKENVPIGGFEEPEEALEPLRQAQLAQMLRKIADEGGQVFIVTHSPEIARNFEIDDFFLLKERAAGGEARALKRVLTPPVRQTYERWLDGAVVRGLFAKIPILVEGPGDRAVLQVFWRGLMERGALPLAAQVGADIVNCEGAPNIPMLAAVLDQAGKSVVVWAEQDTDDVRKILARIRDEKRASAIMLHDPSPERQNLEQALAFGCSLKALGWAMKAIAEDRGYGWEAQRQDLASRCPNEGARVAVAATADPPSALASLSDDVARTLVARCLGAKGVTPFEMKGGRQARIVAETILASDGVPANFARVLRGLARWIAQGCPRGAELTMADAPATSRS